MERNAESGGIWRNLAESGGIWRNLAEFGQNLYAEFGGKCGMTCGGGPHFIEFGTSDKLENAHEHSPNDSL